MSFVCKLEVTFAKWNKGIPHIPARGKQWLVDCAWWLAGLTVVGIVGALFASIPQLLTSIALSSVFNLLTPSAYYYENPVGLAWAATTIIMFSFVINAVMVSMSVSLLKVKDKRGWDITFWAYLISIFCYTVGGLMTLNAVILGAALFVAVVAGYLLFEVRDYFVAHPAVAKVTAESKHAIQ
jgi:hypothetical protein